jgi:hypothetical protein
MTDEIKPPDAARLLYDLQHSDELQRQPVAEAALSPQMALLRTWQSQRLAQTYADLLADPRSGPALRFFLSDLYAPRDFSRRDHDVEQIYAFLSRVMPAQTLQLLTDVIALNRLTTALDNDLCYVLVEQLGVTDTLTPECYAEGYRICANYESRVHQINLIATALAQVGAGARMPVVGLAMKLVRIPAQRAGWEELYDFLKRGYAAFKQLRDVTTFVGTIAQRERRILNQIYSGDPAPFTV